MSQADREFTDGEDRLSVPEDDAGRLNMLIQGSPAETLQVCAQVVEFIGTACDSIEHNGGADYGPAACYMLRTVAAALNYEAVRADLHYARKGGEQ